MLFILVFSVVIILVKSAPSDSTPPIEWKPMANGSVIEDYLNLDKFRGNKEKACIEHPLTRDFYMSYDSNTDAYVIGCKNGKMLWHTLECLESFEDKKRNPLGIRSIFAFRCILSSPQLLNKKREFVEMEDTKEYQLLENKRRQIAAEKKV